MNLNYCLLSLSDFDATMELQYACYPLTACEGREAGLSSVRAYPRGFAGCFDGIKLVGYSSCFPWKGEHIHNEEVTVLPDPDYLYVADVAVAKEYRGNGIGATLMQMVINEGNKLGLEVRGYAVQGAEALWRRMGFEIGEEINFGGLSGYRIRRPCDTTKG